MMESPPPTPQDTGPVCLDSPLSSGLLSLRFWGVDTRFWVCVCPSLSAASPPEPLAAPRSQPAAPGLCHGRVTLLRPCAQARFPASCRHSQLTDWSLPAHRLVLFLFFSFFHFFFFFFFTNFVYLLTAPGLCCCVWPSSSCRALGCSPVAEHGLSS